MAAGVLLLIGMLTGVWKYVALMNSPERRAPVYVDIAHRAALMYSFASLVILELVRLSVYSTMVNAAAASAALVYFHIAVFLYIFLGLQNRTENQFEERNFITTFGMYMLIVAEIGGVVVLLAGAFGL